MIHNVVIGTPLVIPSLLLAFNERDWEESEKRSTLFTQTRYLPAIMKEAGLVQSISEIKRNRPELCLTLDTPDCINIKCGKKFLFIIVGK